MVFGLTKKRGRPPKNTNEEEQVSKEEQKAEQKEQKNEDTTRIDPRKLLEEHRNKTIELIRLEAEFNYLVVDGKYKGSIIRKEVEELAQLLIKAGLTKEQIEENYQVAREQLEHAYD